MLIDKNIWGLVLLTLCIFTSPMLSANNSLADHPSPYLAMHADDPINWHICDEAVLKQAQQQNKLIFVFIILFQNDN